MANDTPNALVAATLAVAVRGEDEPTRQQDADRLLANYKYILGKMRDDAAREANDGIDAYLESMGNRT